MQFVWQYVYRLREIRRFSKRISLKKNLAYFNHLYQNVDGYRISNEATNENKRLSFIYGEVEFFSFAALLSLVQPKVDEVFVDLGSGVGKACVTAALAFNLKHCRGIEIVPALHQQAMKVYEACDEGVQQQLDFVCDDYLKQPLSSADIVYLNATALFGDAWLAIEEKLTSELPVNARILVGSKSLNGKRFQLLGRHAVGMDYGQGHVNVYQKL